MLIIEIDRVSWRRPDKPFGARLRQVQAFVVNVLAERCGLSVAMVQITLALTRLLDNQPFAKRSLDPSLGSIFNESACRFQHGRAGHWFRAF